MQSWMARGDNDDVDVGVLDSDLDASIASRLIQRREAIPIRFMPLVHLETIGSGGQSS